MRVRLRFRLEGPAGQRIPVNYNSWLVSAVYRWLALSSSDYADFLHNEGYRMNNRVYKLFCFSQLQVSKRRVLGEWLHLEAQDFSWCVSSAKEEFIAHLLAGFSKDPELTVAGVRATGQKVEQIPEPSFKLPVQFVCLSPITVSIWDADSTKNPIRYLAPGKEFVEAVRVNLKRKHQLIFGKPPSDESFGMNFDADYAARRKRITRLINFKGIKVRGVLCPFTVDGSKELVRVGYECGFGEKNSIGFGMVEARGT
ncbi:MAG TPA: CRISPR-associated endoribonuclease Cas6 [bacterium]|nr:CRISPR-associated endoribonuclease Cas6 [bacterium]